MTLAAVRSKVIVLLLFISSFIVALAVCLCVAVLFFYLGIFVHYSGLFSIFFNYPAGTTRERERWLLNIALVFFVPCVFWFLCLSFTS